MTSVGKTFIASSSRSMLSRAESGSLSATTVDGPLDYEELEYRLGDVVLIISSSVVPRTFVRLGLATHVGEVEPKSSQNARFFTKSFFGEWMTSRRLK